ncbi:MAG TPA: heat-inducible transcriptional repressor HrcA [Bacteroidota bacterium]|nr:heat-inducible transcriptional repressor HrcA [Bacteroidota bacterium]
MVTETSLDQLNDRERGILRHVVYNYIQTATPVGSRYISRRFESGLSAATIRNVMADLEERGYLSHPHTSAGRIPTDLGYRYYVDFLMEVEHLSENEKKSIENHLVQTLDPDTILRETSKLLSKISKQLSIVSSPHISSGIFEKLELIPLSSSKLLVVMSISKGLIKTIMLEVGVEIPRHALDDISRKLNERLSGLRLHEIRDTFAERMRDVQDEKSGLVRLFIESVDHLFADSREQEKLHIAGTQNIIEQPEFVDPQKFRGVIEMIENEEIIVHLLEKHDEMEKEFAVTIGSENNDQKAEDYSVVTATYDVQGVKGRVGIIGPRRMNYAKVIPIVDYFAKSVVRLLSSS